MSGTTRELIAFLRGRLDLADLPAEIELHADLWRMMDRLWRRSVERIEQGQVSEWGGVLVLDKDDNLKLVNPRQGTAGYVPIEYEAEDEFVGSFHTHPYASGITGVGFSGADIADTINSGERLSILQSGEDVFMLLRTDTTPTWVNVQRLKREHDDLHYDYLSRMLSVQRAIHYTNVDLCEAYGLALYVGVVFHKLEEVYRP